MLDNLHSNFDPYNINCNFDDFGDAVLFHKSIDFEFDDICHRKVSLKFQFRWSNVVIKWRSARRWNV